MSGEAWEYNTLQPVVRLPQKHVLTGGVSLSKKRPVGRLSGKRKLHKQPLLVCEYAVLFEGRLIYSV